MKKIYMLLVSIILLFVISKIGIGVTVENINNISTGTNITNTTIKNVTATPNVTKNITPPTTSIIGVSEGGKYNTNLSISFSVIDNSGSGIAKTEYNLNGVNNTYLTQFNITDEGNYTIKYWSIDNNGSIEIAKSINFAIDKTPPNITAPSNITVESTGESTFVDIGKPNVTDNLDTNPIITNNGPVNSNFNNGVTKVIWTAKDFAENNAMAEQLITVRQKGINFMVDRNSIIVGPREDAIYTFTIVNTKNQSDIFNFKIESPDLRNINASLNLNEIFLDSGKNGTIILKINSSIGGAYIVNVTARSISGLTADETITTLTRVMTANITNFTIESGNKGQIIRSNLTIKNFDTIDHWLVAVVSGTDINGFPIVGTGTIFIKGNITNNATSGTEIIAPIFVTIPPSAIEGNYSMFASIYQFDYMALNLKNPLGNITGPQIMTVN